MPKVSEFEQLVLLALARAGERGYGMEVRRIMEDRADRRASLAAVYSTLARLEEQGLVASAVAPPTGRRGGRATKHFGLTEDGARALEASREAMARMWDGIELERYREVN